LWPSNAGLGTIAYGANGDQKRVTDIQQMWEGYDGKFGDRHDYRLWRRAARYLFPTATSRRWGSLVQVANEALDTEDIKHAWGVLAVLSGCLARRANLTKWNAQGDRERDFTEPDALKLADRAEQRLSSLQLLTEWEAECAIISCLLLDAWQNLRHKLKQVAMTAEEARSYLNRFTKVLRAADPNWQPGWRPISFDAVRQRRRESRDAIAPFDVFQLCLRMREPFYNIRGIVHEAIVSAQHYDRDLLDHAYRFAVSTWRYGRALNRGQEKWLEDARRLGASETTVRAQLLVSQLEELRALFRASQAARDLGDMLESGRLSYLLLRRIPNWVVTAAALKDVVPGWASRSDDEVSPDKKNDLSLDKRFVNLVKDIRGYPGAVCGAIRQVGLEPDPRFPRPARDARGTRPPTACVGKPKPKEPLDMLVEADQSSDPRWQSLKESGYQFCPNKPFRPLQELHADLKQGKAKLNTEKQKHDAFGICIHYGHVATAARILECLSSPSLSDLGDLAHSMKRASQVAPVGIEPDQHGKWREILRRTWASMPLGEDDWEALTEDEMKVTLILHETLIGRGLAIIRDSGEAVTTLLVEKHYGALTESVLRDTLDVGEVAGARGCATVTPGRLQEWLRETPANSNDGLGAPVCVSLTLVNSDTLGILMVANGQPAAYRSYRCKSSVLKLLKNLEPWLLKFAINPAQAIPWGRFLGELAKSIAEQACQMTKETRGRAAWLLLAAPPELAGLPWQLLFRDVCQGRNVVVSLVPNLSWAAMARKPTRGWTTGITLSLNRSANLAQFREHLERDAEQLAHRLESVGVVFGHGVPVPDAPTICFTDRPLWVKHWLKIAKRRFCLVFSCSAAKGDPVFLGDIGGVPGLVLGGETMLLCAPVAEIPIEAASKLHQWVMNAEAPAEFGLRYLGAVQECPQVGLFNLYGLADEPVATGPEV
jgi:hypothetical protein